LWSFFSQHGRFVEFQNSYDGTRQGGIHSIAYGTGFLAKLADQLALVLVQNIFRKYIEIAKGP